MDIQHLLVYGNQKEVWAKNLRTAITSLQSREKEIASSQTRAVEMGVDKISDEAIAEIKAAGELHVNSILGAEPTLDGVIAKLEEDARIQAEMEAEIAARESQNI